MKTYDELNAHMECQSVSQFESDGISINGGVIIDMNFESVVVKDWQSKIDYTFSISRISRFYPYTRLEPESSLINILSAINSRSSESIISIEFWNDDIQSEELLDALFVSIDDKFIVIESDNRKIKLRLSRLRSIEFDGDSIRKALELAKQNNDDVWYDYTNAANELMSNQNWKEDPSIIADVENLLWADVEYSKSSPNTKANSLKTLGELELNRNNKAKAVSLFERALSYNQKLPIKKLLKSLNSESPE